MAFFFVVLKTFRSVTNNKKSFLLFQMPVMVSSSNLPIEKNFRRLLSSVEKLLDEKSIENWKLDQVKNAMKSRKFYFLNFF